MRRITLRVLAVAALALGAGAQTFDAASVKLAPKESRYAMRGGPGTSDPERITYTKVTLKNLLTRAYGVETYQVAAPPWSGEERYDLAAKLPPGATKEQLKQMLRSLLVERFGLAEHRETRDLPIYALVAGKNGPKLKVSEADDAPPEGGELTSVSLAKDGLPQMPAGRNGIIGMTIAGKTMLRAHKASLSELASLLTSLLDRPVFDMSGLKDKYDFGIAWSTDDAIAHGSSLPPGMEPGPDVFVAVQAELGLKLEPRRAPVEMVVVDRVERTPTAN